MNKLQINNIRKGGVRITVKNLQKKIPINPKRVKSAVLKTLSQERAKKSGEINLCFVNDKKIKELNLRYRDCNNPTDVMSFDIAQPRSLNNIFADIVISTDTAIRQAKIFNTSTQYELYLYVIHGVLHLLGYNDRTLKDRRIMAQKAGHILNLLKIK